ncbi:TPA: putative holin-like toxin [Staphylococcus pseudintermedius]|nr:type I toxin-antitoxin system toxin PepG1 [Staphylococcus pseudintermedius]MCA4772814.1 putative holin-like toxin [Staphylococcus pseudintermedius]HAR6048807.1 putative holin-like toxin [Staphylococcus pseudintermedius]
MSASTKSLERRALMISIADALMIMLGFGTFTVTLIHLVVSIDKKSKK